MMKRGFALTLMTVAIALVQVSTSHATAPVISDPGDVIIGDLEDRSGTTPNVFVAPDVIDGDSIVTDDSTADNQIKWSFTGDGSIEVNGVAPLDPGLAGLGDDDPTSPRASSRIDLVNADGGGPVDTEDANARTFTFRNVDLSPDNTSDHSATPDGLLATDTVTLFASDCTTFSSRTITVFTIKGESDGLSGAGPETVKVVDFTTTTDGWIGGPQAGFGGTVSSGASGLCMNVPAAGNNLVLWLSPESYIELVDRAVYRVRTDATTDQSGVDAIPLWFLIYSNSYYLTNPGDANNYGGFAWVLDVDGGAQGIGRANGRNQYDFWYTVNAGGTPQFSAGAFTPAADALNDTTLQFQIIDANVALLSQNDSGTICIAGIEVGRTLRDNLQTQSTAFNPPIDSATHFVLNDFGSPGTTAAIDNANDEADIDLGTAGDVRVTFGYFDSTLANLNQQLYPVQWTGDTLYRTRTNIRAQAQETDPVDAIFVAMDVTNSELGMQSYTTRSGGSVMVFSTSPKLTSAEYDGVFYSQNPTDSVSVDADRLRGFPFLFNTTNLFGDGTGGDAVEIESLEIDVLVSN